MNLPPTTETIFANMQKKKNPRFLTPFQKRLLYFRIFGKKLNA